MEVALTQAAGVSPSRVAQLCLPGARQSTPRFLPRLVLKFGQAAGAAPSCIIVVGVRTRHKFLFSSASDNRRRVRRTTASTSLLPTRLLSATVDASGNRGSINDDAGRAAIFDKAHHLHEMS